MDKISVIISIYNVEKYLKKCIDSVISQTYKNLEIILVDDGATDTCPKICDEYAKLDERVEVVHKKNGGLSSARNAGLDVAKGEYVCFFDSDDFVECDMLEKLIKAIEVNDGDVCVCGYKVDIQDEQNQTLSSRDVVPPCLHVDNNLTLSQYEKLLGICGYAWNKLYKKKFLLDNDLKFEEGVSLVEDMLFNAKVFDSGAKVCFLQYAPYHYVQRKIETLGTKYYENYLQLKVMALQAKCLILKSFDISKEQISTFNDVNYVDVLWGTVKNVSTSSLSTREKRLKVKELIKSNNVKKRLKQIRQVDKKRKTKKLMLKILTPMLLLKVVK